MSYKPSMRGKSYQYTTIMLAQLEKDKYDLDPGIIGMVMMQLTLKAAIKTWGDDARLAAESEMKQLHWRKSFRPVKYSKLNAEQKKTILESHIFMKKKKTGEIKGKAMIDTEEERDIVVIDMLNAFIQTVIQDKKDMLIKIAPEVYQEYTTLDKHGNKPILVECLNALYGMMVANILY